MRLLCYSFEMCIWKKLCFFCPPEFERYSIPEDLIPLGSFALPGLARFPQAPDLFEEDFIEIAPLPNLSPVKMPNRSGIDFTSIFMDSKTWALVNVKFSEAQGGYNVITVYVISCHNWNLFINESADCFG